jgi:predicted MFS family arabinose efflux permease
MSGPAFIVCGLCCVATLGVLTYIAMLWLDSTRLDKSFIGALLLIAAFGGIALILVISELFHEYSSL